jgi:transposase
MFKMGKHHPETVRNQAIGMLLGGMTQSKVSKTLNISLRNVRRWWKAHKDGKDQKQKPGRGRKSALNRAAKITIAKSLTKKHQSTRKLARRLTKAGHKVSHMTVHKYLRKTLKVLPFKPQIQPKLTEKQIQDRIYFCKERKNWTINDWKRVIFSDESPFEIFHSPNRQNDRVWAASKENVEPTVSIKHPLKIMVWGAMSYRALSDLHTVPQGQTVTAAYYTSEILEKCLTAAINRSQENGSVLERKLIPDMSKMIFQQDGAPAHHAKISQEWCEKNLVSFWGKGTWPGNSPDLNPIENL